MKRRHALAIGGAGIALAAFAAAVLLNSSKKVTLGQVRSAADRQPLDAIDHRVWDQLLVKYVNDEGLVDYQRWHDTADDVTALDGYLAELSRGEVSELSRADGKLAFWTNAYNALCLRGILHEYPLSGLPSRRPWFWKYHLHRDLLLIVGDRRYSLDDIGQQLAALKEPLVYLAVDCTDRNGPLLRNSAYLPETVVAQLADTARRHFAQSNRLKVEPAQNQLWIGPAVQWHQPAFGATPQAAAATVAVYFPDDESRRLATSAKSSIQYLPVDDRLNDQANLQESNP
jgi:hypothetical protein